MPKNIYNIYNSLPNLRMHLSMSSEVCIVGNGTAMMSNGTWGH